MHRSNAVGHSLLTWSKGPTPPDIFRRVKNVGTYCAYICTYKGSSVILFAGASPCSLLLLHLQFCEKNIMFFWAKRRGSSGMGLALLHSVTARRTHTTSTKHSSYPDSAVSRTTAGACSSMQVREKKKDIHLKHLFGTVLPVTV
jgi:hypothetical protein